MSFTIVDSLLEQVKSQPEKIAFRYLVDEKEPSQDLTYSDLYNSASDIANFLLSIAAPSSRIMLLFPPGLSYIKAFYGCLLAGMIAVPLYPPKKNAKSDRVINVARSCESTIALTAQIDLGSVKSVLNESNCELFEINVYSVDELPLFSGKPDKLDRYVLPDVAFLQFTSGSTGLPKGVIITHSNIIANVEHLRLTTTANQGDVFVNWLPLFHDLGLVTAVLLPVYLGSTSILMSPASFVRNPLFWLKAISYYQGTIGGAPNFAYDLCVKKITSSEASNLELGSWRIAFNAAEPIRSATLNEFSSHFSSGGFKSTALYPSYGMAEATVFISGGESSLEPEQISIEKNSLSKNKIKIMSEALPGTIRLVSCGVVMEPHDVRIVDADTRVQLDDGCIGEIWFSGPSVSPGYWGREDLTSATFNNYIAGYPGYKFLKTGDLGFKWNNQLYVTGRMKDLIILHGENYYPQDIELSVSNSDISVRPGYCVAFSRNQEGIERLCIVAEIEREFYKKIDSKKVEKNIKTKIFHDHGISVYEVVLLKPYKLPVTSSGKVQRALTRQMVIDGRLNDLSIYISDESCVFLEAKTDLEKFLSDTWCNVLNLDVISLNDNFFEIGGSSVSAAEISYKIHEQYKHIELDMEQMFDFPTIAMLARYIELKNAHFAQKKGALNQAQEIIVI